MLTSEEEQKVLKLIDHYHDNVSGKLLSEMLDEPLTLKMVEGMLKLTLRKEGKTDLIGKLGVLPAECIAIGIWLAEIGKTRLLGGKELH